MLNKIDYWLELSIYDLDTAKAMLNAKRYLYVGYMCHQTIEKSLKALYLKIIKDDPPYTHNLIYLCEKMNLEKKLSDDQNKFIAMLMPLNIEARYPKNKDELFKNLNEKLCSDIIIKTEELLKWIKKLLKM